MTFKIPSLQVGFFLQFYQETSYEALQVYKRACEIRWQKELGRINFGISKTVVFWQTVVGIPLSRKRNSKLNYASL